LTAAPPAVELPFQRAIMPPGYEVLRSRTIAAIVGFAAANNANRCEPKSSYAFMVTLLDPVQLYSASARWPGEVQSRFQINVMRSLELAVFFVVPLI